MADLVPTYDATAVAADLRLHLDTHRETIKLTISAPATTPMFTREPSGALVDRNGRVLVQPLVPPKS